MPPTLKPSAKLGLPWVDSLTLLVSTDKFLFKTQLTWLFTVSKSYKSKFNQNRYIDHYISYASRQLAPHEYWTANNKKNFFLPMSSLRPSVFDLHSHAICEKKTCPS